MQDLEPCEYLRSIAIHRSQMMDCTPLLPHSDDFCFHIPFGLLKHIYLLYTMTASILAFFSESLTLNTSLNCMHIANLRIYFEIESAPRTHKNVKVKQRTSHT